MKSILFLTLIAICSTTAQAEIYACDDGVITDRACKGSTIAKRPAQITESTDTYIYACNNNTFTDRPCAGGKILTLQPEPSKEVQKNAFARLQKELKREEQKSRETKAEQERAYQQSLLERAVIAMEYNAYQAYSTQTNLLQLPSRPGYIDRRIYNIHH